LRAAAHTLARKHNQDVTVIDEAFASYNRIDSPVRQQLEHSSENGGTLPPRLSECLFAQLSALDRETQRACPATASN
jgi:hypothetical protein